MAPWDRRHPCRPASAGRDAGGPRTHAPLQTMPSEIALGRRVLRFGAGSTPSPTSGGNSRAYFDSRRPSHYTDRTVVRFEVSLLQLVDASHLSPWQQDVPPTGNDA